VVAIEVSSDNTGRAISIGVPTATLIGYTVATLLKLRDRQRTAKVLCAMTGSLLIVVGLVLVATLFGLIPIVLGIAVIWLSFRREEVS
jgi:cadmium resistance protein CadD (predicted permease)